MKSEKLIEFLRHPEKIGADDLRELDELVNRYPFFQTARIIYLKALYTQAGTRFRNELRASTVHLTDHKQFYRYLNGQIKFDINYAPSSYTDLSNIVDSRIKEINGHIIVNSQGIPAYSSTSSSLEQEEDEIIALNLQQENNTQQAGISPKQKTRLKRPEKEANVISNPIQLDQIPGVIDDYTEKTTRETEVKTAPIINKVSPTILDLTDIPGMIQEETPSSVSAQPAMNLNLDLEEEDEKEVAPISPEIESVTTLNTPEILGGAYRFTEEKSIETAPKAEKKKQKTRKKKDELIEQFIQSDPGMPKITSTTDNRDLSKENPYSQEELFSETLAKIYIRQHLYEKAIATYIKLSLKYPEKSVYFADRIEKIKENINNKE